MTPKKVSWTIGTAVAVGAWWHYVGDDLWLDFSIRRLLRKHARARRREQQMPYNEWKGYH